MRKLLLALAALLSLPALFLSCNTESGEEQVFTFPTLADSLKGADSVIIILKTEAGDTIDVLFKDRITDKTEFKNLAAPHYEGGKVVVDIQAFKDGKPFGHIEKGYSGESGKTDTTKIISTKDASLLITKTPIRLAVGDSTGLPAAEVAPATLSDKTVVFSSKDPSVLKVENGRLKGISNGTA